MEDWKEYKLKDVAYLTSGFPLMVINMARMV